MRNIQTSIEINAAPEKVWRILTDFTAYPSWNPFVKSISGHAQVGQKLTVLLGSGEKGGMKFSPRVLKAEPNHELRRLGKLLFKGLFDGEHYFRIEPIETEKVRFVRGENFSGALVALFYPSMQSDTESGFSAMNAALKRRAENI